MDLRIEVRVKMQLSEFSDRCERIASTSGNDMRDEASSVLEEVGPDDAEMFVRFLLGERFSDPEKRTHVGTSLLFDAVAQAYGVTEAELEAAEEERGKPELGIEEVVNGGSSAQAAFGSSQDLGDIYSSIQKLPDASGNKERVRIMQGMFTNCDTAEEAKWVAFCIVDDMSLGVGSGTVKQALVESFGVSREAIDNSYAITGSMPEIVRMVKEDVELTTEPEPGKPFSPMAAKNKDTDECENWFCQPKFDGARVLIHSDGDIRIFTRNRNEVTESIPEVVEAMDSSKEFIVDGEAVGYHPETGDVLPLNETMKRFRRERNVDEMRQEIEIRVFLFDIIHYDNENLLDSRLGDRLDRLDEVLGEIVHGEVEPLSEWSDAALGGAIGNGLIATTPFSLNQREMFDRSLELGHEGVIIKDPHSKYLLDERDETWRKVKTEATLDLRVIGYEPGTGDRAGGLGALQLETSDGVEVGFVGTGFTDEQIHSLEPDDVMGEIIEVEAEGPVMEGSIRFPRFQRFRQNKDEADSFDRVKRILS